MVRAEPGDTGPVGPSTFVELIDLEPLGRGVFRGPEAPERHGRTFGGQFLAQAIAAAQHTVTGGKQIHSLHAYFVRGGDVNRSTEYEVEAVRDGRSFGLRSVVARQDGEEVYRMTASFHVPEPGFDFQAAPDLDMQALPAPHPSQPDYVAFGRLHPDFDAESWDGARRPMDIRYINPPDQPGSEPVLEPQLMWIRVPDPLPAEQGVHAAALAYLADSTLIDHCLLPHGLRWFDKGVNGASLDHAMWFHRPVRADEWLLYDQRVDSTSAGRGSATGRFYDRSGCLVASCTQEGLIRWSDD